MARISLGVPKPLDMGFDSVPILKPPTLSVRGPGLRKSLMPKFLDAQPPVQSPLAPTPQLGVQAAPPAPAAAPQPAAPPPPAQPTPPPVAVTPPPAPTPTPAPAPTPALGVPEPSLNYEGNTFQPQSPSQAADPDTATIANLIRQVEEFGPLNFGSDAAIQAQTDPEALRARVKRGIDAMLNDPNLDAKAKQRYKDWYAAFTQALDRKSAPGTNPDYGREVERAKAFNEAQTRLTQELGYSGRDDEEQLLQILAQRGLLNSGIASRELAGLQARRTQNYNTQLSEINQMLTQGNLNYIDAETMAKLQAKLQLMNESELAKLKAALQIQIEKAGQPSAIAQVVGAIVGGVGGMLASPSKLMGLTPEEEIGNMNNPGLYKK